MTGDPEHFRKFEKLEEKLSSMKVEGCHIELHSENTVCCRTFGGHCISKHSEDSQTNIY